MSTVLKNPGGYRQRNGLANDRKGVSAPDGIERAFGPPTERKFAEGAPDEPKYERHYVLKHAAKVIGVSEKVLRSAVEKKDVRGIRLGHRTLIPGSEVRRLVEAMT